MPKVRIKPRQRESTPGAFSHVNAKIADISPLILLTFPHPSATMNKNASPSF
jgi:hypothetical protein